MDILPKMGSLVLTSNQVFSESRFRYGFQVMEFRNQKSGLVPSLNETYAKLIFKIPLVENVQLILIELLEIVIDHN